MIQPPEEDTWHFTWHSKKSGVIEAAFSFLAW
jgi:hypothetical protein